MAQTAEAGDDFVGNVEHFVPSAHVECTAVITGRRNDHAARGQDRLGDEACDVLGPQLQDLLLEIGHLGVAEGLERLARGAAVGIGTGQMVNTRGDQIHHAAIRHLARHRCRELRAAVIGVFTRDDVLLGRLADEVEIEVHEPQGRVRRGRAAGGEEHALDVARRIPCQASAQLHRRRRGERAEGRVVAHANGLVGDGTGHFLSPIPDVHAPHAAHAIDQGVSAGLLDMNAFGLGDDDGRARFRRAQLRPGMEVMAAVGLRQAFDIVGTG